MTPEQKWFDKLEKLLSQMPKGFEISVVTRAQNSCDVHLHTVGAIKELESKGDDRMFSSFSSVAIDSFTASRVIANSESY